MTKEDVKNANLETITLSSDRLNLDFFLVMTETIKDSLEKDNELVIHVKYFPKKGTYSFDMYKVKKD